MKLFVLILLSALFLTGCGGDSSSSPSTTNSPGTATTNASSSGNPLTAPVDYLGAVGKAQRDAMKTVDTASLDKSIQLFHVEQGRYPKSLEELVEKKFIPSIPPAPFGMKLQYDATSGKVSVVKH